MPISKIKVMLSSTIKDMLDERDAIIKFLESTLPFIEVIGAEPVQGNSTPSSPFINTTQMAEDCDFYLLLLGERYGYEIRPGTSATEVEFDSAYQQNPTKILVFMKDGMTPEKKQKKFINKVVDYYKGYWITKYKYSHDLQDMVKNSLLQLLKERAAIGYKLNYFDHFIRIAIQRKPVPDAVVLYTVQGDDIEFSYIFFSKTYVIQFKKESIFKDFWGCIAKLENSFIRWRS